ncbi:13890_t:CDS:2, partial [Gigaspora margarita]
FTFSLAKSELDKDDKIPRHRVYYCSKEHHYKPKKKAHVLEERNKEHESIISEYSHQMSENIQIVAPQYCHLTPEMQEDIELLASSNIRTRAIINVLTHKYPDQYIYAYCVYNLVQTIKVEKEKLSDAGATYKELMCHKQKMPGWVLKETTNIQLSENLISTGSSNVSNESIGVSGIKIDEAQLQTSQEDDQNKDIQEQS